MSLHRKPTKSSGQRATSVPIETPTPKLGCRRWLRRWLLRCSIGLMIAVVVVFGSNYLVQPRYFNILIIGSDQRGVEQARSDALLVMAIPKAAGDPVSLITIPRDTKIDHPDYGVQKITHFYAIWNDTTTSLGNKPLTEQVVKDLLGIPIHGTIEVTFDSFIEIVDLLGGVDTTAGHLDGKAAKEVVHNRFNKAGGDFGRTDAQREIIQNVIVRLRDPIHARAVYEYMQTTDRARAYLSTNTLTWFGLAYLIGHGGKVSLSEVNEAALPGVGQRIYTPAFDKELYYWVLDETQTQALVDDYLR